MADALARGRGSEGELQSKTRLFPELNPDIRYVGMRMRCCVYLLVRDTLSGCIGLGFREPMPWHPVRCPLRGQVALQQLPMSRVFPTSSDSMYTANIKTTSKTSGIQRWYSRDQLQR